jgi:uncharacterized protein
VLKFGLTAFAASFFGAWFLLRLSDLAPLAVYEFFGKQVEIMPVKLVIALLMILFALFEVVPRLGGISFDKKYLPPGGDSYGKRVPWAGKR